MKRVLTKTFNGHFLEIELLGFIFSVILNIDVVSNKHLSLPSRHNHAYFEVFLFSIGEGKIEIDNAIEDVEGGTMVIIGPNHYHNVLYENKAENTAYSFRFLFRPLQENKHAPANIEADELLGKLGEISFIKCSDSNGGFEVMEKIKTELKNQKMGCNKAIESLMHLLMISCLRNAGRYLSGAEGRVSPKENKEEITKTDSDQRMQDIIRIEKYFADNIADDKMLDSLAEHLHLSNRQTERLIKNHFSMTFREKLMMTRIEEAKGLLEGSQFSIEDIAYKVGYSSRSSFCSSFKNHEGTTPAVYRKQYFAGQHTK